MPERQFGANAQLMAQPEQFGRNVGRPTWATCVDWAGAFLGYFLIGVARTASNRCDGAMQNRSIRLDVRSLTLRTRHER